MSHSDQPTSKKPTSEKPTSESRPRVRFSDSVSCDHDDKKPEPQNVDLGSPISILQRPASFSTTSSCSSSCSSGSVSCESSPSMAKKDPNSGKTTNTSTPIQHSSKPGQSRSKSNPSINLGQTQKSSSSSSSSTSSTSSTVNTPRRVILPTGNIFPSGKIPRSGIPVLNTKSDVLGSGKLHYGYGSIMRGGKHSHNPEDVKIAGNEAYRKGHFAEALSLYDKAIKMSPENANYRSNRAAALTEMGRLCEAVKECEEALRFDPTHVRAHQRLARLFLR